jgi:hypothetical protein
MTDGVDQKQQKLKMRDLYRSISEIDLHQLADGASHVERITEAKTEALSALSTWFTENGFTSWFEENRLAEERHRKCSSQSYRIYKRFINKLRTNVRVSLTV